VRADADDARLVEVLQELLGDVRDVAGDLLRSELRIAGFDLELLDVDRGERVFPDQFLGDEDRVFEVVAAPRHERHEDVAAERQLAPLGARPVGHDLPLLDALALADDRTLVDAGVLVRALELRQRVDVRPEVLAALGAHADDDALAVHEIDDAGALADHDRAGVLRRHGFHARADEGRLGPQQRDGLTLHVRSHQRAVGVVVLEERDQRCGDGDELLGRDVDVGDLVLRHQLELARLAGVDALVGERQVRIQLRVRLGDDRPVFLPRGEVERVRLGFGRRLGRLPQPLDILFELVLADDVVQLVRPVRGAHDPHVVDDLALLDLAIRRFDEAVVVDAREARQRRDQTDVRPFGRLDRTDASVVRRMDVADLEAGALAGQAARAEGRKTALVRDFGERVGLVHELGQLTASKELLDRRHHGLGVDQVVRHGRRHFLVDRHLLFDRALHAHETDAELVLEQLADASNAPVAEMVDVVGLAHALAELEHVAQDLDEILAAGGPVLALVPLLADVGRPVLFEHPVELRVELQPPDLREVVPRRIEEQTVEEVA
jgi:hypothetical protein